MAKTQTWFEGELRRMLGFDEVEEIARFALDSFSVSQSAELKQYLEQFLGQSREVETLCGELSARRKGGGAAAPATKARAASSSQGAQKTPGAASDDFWGTGGGMAGSQAANRSKLLAAAPAAGSGRGGRQAGKPPPPAGGNVKGRGIGKVYQKAAVEEDFWGGGTTTGRSKTSASSSFSSSSAKPGSNPVRPAVGAVAPAPAPSATAVAAGARKGGGTSGRSNSTKGGDASGNRSATASTMVKKAGAKQPPAGQATATTTNKSGRGDGGSSGGKKKVAATPPPLIAASAGGATKRELVAAVQPDPEWSGVTCLCMGKTHDVVTNCTSCGKIACVKEGGFGCSFCGSKLPSTGREPRKETKNSSSSSSSSARGGDVDGHGAQSAALKEALERKDRLLLFDRTSALRTTVLDDQGDYFTSHNWLSQGEREKGEAEEKARRDDAASKRGARRQVKMSIDIMGRRVIETQQQQQEEEEMAEAGGGGGGRDAGGAKDASSKTAGGLSLDFGSSSTASGKGKRSADRGGSGPAGGGYDGNAAEELVPRAAAGDRNSLRPSLENTGLRGRAKEVYDVMRANLEKKSRRRRPGGKTGAAGAGVEKSRVSMWRVQQDVDSDDDLSRQNQPGGDYGEAFGNVEPTEALTCAR
ncbi:unnamed protein product [Pylaiella littoralis]